MFKEGEQIGQLWDKSEVEPGSQLTFVISRLMVYCLFVSYNACQPIDYG